MAKTRRLTSFMMMLIMLASIMLVPIAAAVGTDDTSGVDAEIVEVSDTVEEQDAEISEETETISVTDEPVEDAEAIPAEDEPVEEADTLPVETEPPAETDTLTEGGIVTLDDDGENGEHEGVRIDKINFPDPSFRSIITQIDANEDGYLTADETYYKKINVEESNIASLKGIEYFPNLELLICNDNALTSLDVSQNKNLITLSCESNQLTSLNISDNSLLQNLYCNGNSLSEIDISHCPHLVEVVKEGNFYQGGDFVGYIRYDAETDTSSWAFTFDENSKVITGEDNPEVSGVEINEENFPDSVFRSMMVLVDKNEDGILSDDEFGGIHSIDASELGITTLKGIEYFTELEDLDCCGNSLTTLDVSKNTKLAFLYCSSNALTSLDLSNNACLTKLYCEDNKLSSIDLSGCPLLVDIVKNSTFYQGSAYSGYFCYDAETESYSCMLMFDNGVQIITGDDGPDEPGNNQFFLNLRLDALKYDVTKLPMSTLLRLLAEQNNGFTIPGDESILWWYDTIMDTFSVQGRDSTVDCVYYNNEYFYRRSFSFGSVGYYYYYSIDNTRLLRIENIGQQNTYSDYYITINVINDIRDGDLSFSLYRQTSDGSRIEEISKSDFGFDHYYYVPWFDDYDLAHFEAAAYTDISLGAGEQLYIDARSGFQDSGTGVEIKVYDSDNNDVTSRIMNQNMDTANAGYAIPLEGDQSIDLTFKYYSDGRLIDTCVFHFSNQVSPYIQYALPMLDDGSIVNVFDENVSWEGNELIMNIPTDSRPMGTGIWLRFLLRNIKMGTDAGSYIEKSVNGDYNSLFSAKHEMDVTNWLFSQTGYPTEISEEGETFTVFMKNGDIYKIRCNFTDTITVDYDKSYFYIIGLRDSNGSLIKAVFDSAWSGTLLYNYSTVLVLDGNVDLSRVIPVYFIAEGCTVHVGSITPASGETEIDFSDGSVQFQVDVPGVGIRNYFVKVVKAGNSGSELYVEGPQDVRELVRFYGSGYNYSDVRIYNIGDQPLTGLNAYIENAENVKLDEYYTVGKDRINTLSPFAYDGVNISEDCMATIRVIPVGDGDISGTLVITADGQEPVRIMLTGGSHSDSLKINGEAMDDAVKYVPYSFVVPTNNTYPWVTTDFSLDGDLPDGVSFNPKTGEIYGVPKETGEFPVTVTVEFTDKRAYTSEWGVERITFEPSTVSYVLTVKDNTNANVYNETDEGYSILDSVGTDAGGYDFVLTEIGDQTFRSEGELGEFIDLWLNGEKLVEGVDYKAESGSTKIIIYSNTFADKANSDGFNTLAAEFRTDTGTGNDSLRRTAQNFRITLTQSGGSGTGDGGGSSGGTGSSGSGSSSGGSGSASGGSGSSGKAGGSSNPRTGDTTNIEMYFVFMLLSMTAIVYIITYHRRECSEGK